MSYHEDIYQAVLNSAALAALIEDRFCWDVADGSTLVPYIVAQTISDSGETDHDGTRDLSFPLIQVTAWAKTKAEAVAIMRAWKADLEGVDIPGTSAHQSPRTNTPPWPKANHSAPQLPQAAPQLPG